MRVLPPASVLVVFVLLVCCQTTRERSSERTAPPNIVYILADDLGYGELGCYGQKKIKTPHLDRLARQGMRFVRHYSGAPVCAPSRCVLLTGKHLGRATIRDNKEVRPEGQWPIQAEDTTIATMLRARGYATACVGKWGLGPVGSTGDPNRHGFDLFYGYNCQRVAHSYYPPHLWRNKTRIVLNEKPVRGHDRSHARSDEPIDFSRYRGAHYATDRLLDAANQFVTENKDRPFFLYFAPLEPHVAMHPPRKHVERYPREWDAGPYRGGRGYLPHPRPRAGYAAMISDLDERVGQLVARIDELGLAENTLIIFSSDNGPTHDVGGVDTRFFASSGGLRGRKGSVYEGGIRVPMIARWKGKVAPGSVSDHLSAFPDVMPTLAELAGAAVPQGATGVSFVPTLTGRGAQRRHAHLLWEFHGYGGQQAVIFRRWKVVRRGIRRKPGAFEVFDLEQDPQESKNVAQEHPELVARAAALLATERTVAPDFPMPALDR